MNASEETSEPGKSASTWVTGARGFIGRRLARHLHEHGRLVCGVGHGHLPVELWPSAGLAQWCNSQLSAEALDELASIHGVPETVFHLAGGSAVGASLQAPLEDFKRTTDTTATLLEWLRNNAPRAKLVAASSAAVYGDTHGAVADESRRPAPVSPYGYHKLLMEQLCQEYSQIFGLRTVIVRLFSVYGEGLRKQLLWDSAVKLSGPGESVQLQGTGDELRDWLHVDDACALLHAAGGHASESGPIFNGGSGRGVRVREIVTLLATALGRDKPLEFSGLRRRGDPAALIADATLSAALGYSCSISLTAGLQRYADWFSHERER
jgi:UDP-glucose 4-epimerase